MSPDDAQALVQWIKRYYRFDHIAFEGRAIRRGVRALLRNPQYGTAWFICADKQIVGYVILTYGFDVEFGGPLGTITDFFNDAEHRARGIGSRVLKQVFAFARRNGLSAIELQVIKKNRMARKFYQRAGFTCHNRLLLSKRIRKPRGRSTKNGRGDRI